MEQQLKVLELYSGIGGMNYAIKESALSASVIAAVDINEVANSVYMHNFPNVNLLQRNILSLTSKEINSYQPDVIMMSPPCQPFTRVGLKKDVQDGRTDSFIHLLTLLPELKSVQYILMENVKGFETSEARNKLISVLDDTGFLYQEFLLSPHSFLVPNMRLRYYLVAKRSSKCFCFPTSNQLMTTFPFHEIFENTKEEKQFPADSIQSVLGYLNRKMCARYISIQDTASNITPKLKTFMDPNADEDVFILNTKILTKYAQILDIVTPDSQKSCCFTKAYGHYVEGTGSVFCPFSVEEISDAYKQCEKMEAGSEDYVKILKKLKLRYFTPHEIARLMCFPKDFSFPPTLTVKQKYRLLGNSINVHVVTLLFVLLTHEKA